MEISVGSTNRIKIRAAEEVFALYPRFCEAKIVPVNVKSGVRSQPLTLEETELGAKTRASRAFSGGLSVGIESGIFQRDKWFNIVAVAIYDGTSHFVGFSSIFWVPPAMARFVLEKGMEMSEAAHAVGMAEDEKIGHREGVISPLTDGHVQRIDLVKQGILCALPPLLVPERYRNDA